MTTHLPGVWGADIFLVNQAMGHDTITDLDPDSGDVILSYSTGLSYIEVMTEFGFIWSIDEDDMLYVIYDLIIEDG